MYYPDVGNVRVDSPRFGPPRFHGVDISFVDDGALRADECSAYFGPRAAFVVCRPGSQYRPFTFRVTPFLGWVFGDSFFGDT